MRPVTVYPRGEGAIASARGLVKVYGSGETAVRALDGVDVDFARGELTAIMGPSGSGKSTLMHCMAGLDTLTGGTVVIDGEDVGRMNQRGLTKLRRDRLGFVFQAYNLIPTLTAEENITLPLDIARRSVDRAWFDRTGWTTGRASCPVGSSSGWPALAPWSHARPWCSPTSRPATWTPGRPVRCWISCGTPSTSWARRS